MYTPGMCEARLQIGMWYARLLDGLNLQGHATCEAKRTRCRIVWSKHYQLVERAGGRGGAGTVAGVGAVAGVVAGGREFAECKSCTWESRFGEWRGESFEEVC